MLKRWRKSKKQSKKRPENSPSEKWIRVAIAPNQVVAGMMEGALESENIPFFEKKIGLDFPTSPSNQREILVPESFRERACSIVEVIWSPEDQ